MISVYLKDSVLTTRLSTSIIDLKRKITKIRILSTKNVCVLYLVGRNIIFELVSKERAFPAWCCTKQTQLEGSYFLKWASIAPTESCVTYLPPDCPSNHFSQKRFGFQSTTMSYTLLFNLDLMSRISEFRPVLFWFGFL